VKIVRDDPTRIELERGEWQAWPLVDRQLKLALTVGVLLQHGVMLGVLLSRGQLLPLLQRVSLDGAGRPAVKLGLALLLVMPLWSLPLLLLVSRFLLRRRFPERLCLDSAQRTLLWNGQPLAPFEQIRAVRARDASSRWLGAADLFFLALQRPRGIQMVGAYLDRAERDQVASRLQAVLGVGLRD
jgi:hypothetical protein